MHFFVIGILLLSHAGADPCEKKKAFDAALKAKLAPPQTEKGTALEANDRRDSEVIIKGLVLGDKVELARLIVLSQKIQSAGLFSTLPKDGLDHIFDTLENALKERSKNVNPDGVALALQVIRRTIANSQNEETKKYFSKKLTSFLEKNKNLPDSEKWKGELKNIHAFTEKYPVHQITNLNSKGFVEKGEFDLQEHFFDDKLPLYETVWDKASLEDRADMMRNLDHHLNKIAFLQTYTCDKDSIRSFWNDVKIKIAKLPDKVFKSLPKGENIQDLLKEPNASHQLWRVARTQFYTPSGMQAMKLLAIEHYISNRAILALTFLKQAEDIEAMFAERSPEDKTKWKAEMDEVQLLKQIFSGERVEETPNEIKLGSESFSISEMAACQKTLSATTAHELTNYLNNTTPSDDKEKLFELGTSVAKEHMSTQGVQENFIRTEQLNQFNWERVVHDFKRRKRDCDPFLKAKATFMRQGLKNIRDQLDAQLNEVAKQRKQDYAEHYRLQREQKDKDNAYNAENRRQVNADYNAALGIMAAKGVGMGLTGALLHLATKEKCNRMLIALTGVLDLAALGIGFGYPYVRNNFDTFDALRESKLKLRTHSALRFQSPSEEKFEDLSQETEKLMAEIRHRYWANPE